MKSNPSDRGRSGDLPRNQPVPSEIADALARAAGRLGRIGSQVLYFQTIGSTNDVAALLAEQAAGEGAVVFADEQTAGRGRRGHTWFSPLATGLYVSVVLAPRRARVDPERATMLLTLAAGVALAEAIEVVGGLRVDLKWPNDLFVARRKLGGILAEAAGPGPAGDGWSSATASTSARRPFHRSSAIARRHSSPSWGARSIACSSWLKRSSPCRGATTICSTDDTMLSSTRGVRGRLAASGRG